MEGLPPPDLANGGHRDGRDEVAAEHVVSRHRPAQPGQDRAPESLRCLFRFAPPHEADVASENAFGRTIAEA